ncbi:unnamed protein product [Penicillium salamii]|uniref:Uncharacterized protein n=1 Tax=Penicillium salamii TaxID=1612424 RepID=A0A9W4NQU3_9EURO|nr:unnamed protein product [Penicillium salamii]CAG8385958.1 unnamed protein product [Penicillium salamii]CAG8395946.1 unnamed protein product [Penicillium salamii]CAG8415829.1 unnamed protein product [Penicillium salamii]
MPFVLASTRSLSFCFWSNVRDRMLCLDWQVFVHISSMHFSNNTAHFNSVSSISAMGSGTKRELSDEHEQSSSKRQCVEGALYNPDPNWPQRQYAQTGSSGSSQPHEAEYGELLSGDPDLVDCDDPATIAKFDQDGSTYIEWMDNPDHPGCPIQLSTMTFQEVIWAKLKKDRYRAVMPKFSPPSVDLVSDLAELGLPTGRVYRDVWLQRHGIARDGRPRFTEFANKTVEGAIVADAIFRFHGHHWSEIALAQYRMDFDINTLRHIYFHNVVNTQTYPYVRRVIYKLHEIPYNSTSMPTVWHYRSRRFREIIGTRLGKSAASIVLGAWPRGTHRIERIQTWVSSLGDLNMRFDIEEITPSPRSSSSDGIPHGSDISID